MINFQKKLFALAMLIALPIALTGHWVMAIACLAAMEYLLPFALPKNALFGANSLGTLTSSLIIQEALDLVFTERPILRTISLNLRDKDGRVDTAVLNQGLVTRLLTIPAVTAFAAGAEARADTDVTVTLTDFKQLYHAFTATEISSTNRNLVRESARPLAVALGNNFVDIIAALWTNANFPTRTGADAVANGSTETRTVKGAGWDYTHLLGIGQTLDDSGVPAMNRFYVGNSAVYASMLSDLRIVAALNNPDNQSAIKLGRLPEVSGFGIAKYPALTAKAGNNLVAFAGTPDSTAFAVRPPRDPAELLPNAPNIMNTGYVTDANSGLTVRVDEWIGTDLSANVRLSWLQGVHVGNPNNGQLIQSVLT